MVDVGPLGPVNPRTGSSRIAVYPDGRSPSGVCPVCGQEDPFGLGTDGCHASCLEWLGQGSGDPCAHPGGEWMWSDRVGRWWQCPACPKPVPPPGPGAGSPTVR